MRSVGASNGEALGPRPLEGLRLVLRFLGVLCFSFVLLGPSLLGVFPGFLFVEIPPSSSG